MKPLCSFFLVLLLISCSSSGKQDYLLIENQTEKTYKNIHEAVKSSEKQTLETNKRLKVAMRVVNPSFYDEGVLSNFQAFKTQKLEDGSYKVFVASYCYECLGYRKKILYPNIYVFDEKYNKINTETESEFSGLAAMITRSDTFNVQNSDSYYIILSADNTRLDLNTQGQKKQDNLTMIIPAPIPLLPYPISASPEGTLNISINKLEP